MKLSHENQCDIFCVGQGLLGHSLAYHLVQKDSYKLGMASKEESFQKPLWSTMGGFFDHYTRLEHQWGEEKAKELWAFGQEACHYAHDLCEILAVSHMKGSRKRFATTQEEKSELRKSSQLLKSSGFKTELVEEDSDYSYDYQDEGVQGGFINGVDFCKALQKESSLGKTNKKEVVSFETQKESVKVNFSDGKSLKTSVLVLCCHESLLSLVPSLKKSLIPYQDQSHLVSYHSKKNYEGLTFSSTYGHIWGTFISKSQIQIGGGRFLRKDAGIGFLEPELKHEIEEFLLKELAKLFPDLSRLKVLSSHASIDFKGQDELPLIGPLPGHDRVFFASGFMGQGLTLAVHAGKILAELLLEGDSSLLPKALRSERFRKF